MYVVSTLCCSQDSQIPASEPLRIYLSRVLAGGCDSWRRAVRDLLHIIPAKKRRWLLVSCRSTHSGTGDSSRTLLCRSLNIRGTAARAAAKGNALKHDSFR
jgi:hypothetical protein